LKETDFRAIFNKLIRRVINDGDCRTNTNLRLAVCKFYVRFNFWVLPTPYTLEKVLANAHTKHKRK